MKLGLFWYLSEACFCYRLICLAEPRDVAICVNIENGDKSTCIV